MAESVLERRLDNWTVWLAAIVPVGLAVGTVAFEAIVVAADLCWMATLLIRRHLPDFLRSRSTPAMALLLWLASVWLSRFVSPNAGLHAWVHDLAFSRHIIFVMALIDIAHRRPVARYLAWGLVTGVAWSAINTVLALTVGYDLVGHPAWRYTGKLKENARIAAICAYAGPMLAFWSRQVFNRQRRKGAWLAFFAVVSFVLLLKSVIRTAIIGSFAGSLFGCLFFVRKNAQLLLKVAAVLCCLILAVGYLASVKGVYLGSLYLRAYIWKVSFAIWKENPFFGVGISSFKSAYDIIYGSGAVSPFVAPDGLAYNLAKPFHAHNLALQLLACTGLFGFLAFGWLFIKLCRLAFADNNPWGPGLATWPVVFLVIGLAGWNIFDAFYATIFSYLAALTATGAVAPTEPAPG